MTTPSVKSVDLLDRVRRILEPTIGPQPTDAPLYTLPPLPSHREQLAARAKIHIKKRQNQRYLDDLIAKEGPQPQQQANLYSSAEPIFVASILDDPEFTNFRRTVDPAKLADLQDSIQDVGLKIPIVVIRSPFEGYYYVRAGFRRLTAIRNLGWETITAIILPADTPETEEYWINIIENTAREKLSTYELAEAARLMRDRFKTPPAVFAKKAGHSLEYISKLLICIDRLPEEVIQVWQSGDRLPLDVLSRLASLNRNEAIRNCRLWIGQHRLDLAERFRALQRKPEKSGRLWTVKGLARSQRLHMALKTSNLSDETKKLCLELVEYLQGARKHIPGIIGCHVKKPKEEPETPQESLENLLDTLDTSSSNVNPANQIEVKDDSNNEMHGQPTSAVPFAMQR
jgi:ParB/RepB/Spo0J family partition protein